MLVTQEFEGTVGATVANADIGASSSSFGAGSTRTFSNTQVMRGTTSMRYTFPTSGSNGYFAWAARPTSYDRLVVRAYFYMPPFSTAREDLIVFVFGITVRFSIGTVNSLSQQFHVVDGSGSVVAGSAVGFPYNEWVRVEVGITPGSTTNGHLSYAIYQGDSTTPYASFSTETANTGTGSLSTFRIGRNTSQTAQRTWYVDDLAADSLASGFIGPSTTEEPGAEDYSGSAALSGGGTLTGAGSPAISRSSNLSGSGTLSGAGKPSVSRSADFTGSGALTASGGTVVADSAALDGTGDLTANGVPGALRSAALSGSGSLTADGVAALTGMAALGGSGALTQAGKPEHKGNADLTGVGALAVGGVPTHKGTVALSGSGTLAGSALAAQTISATAGLAATGSLSAQVIPALAGAAALSGSGLLAAAGAISLTGEAMFTGAGDLSGIGTWRAESNARPFSIQAVLAGADVSANAGRDYATTATIRKGVR